MKDRIRQAIEMANRAGFAVYMRQPSDSFFLYTDGTDIGYIQDDLGGLSLTSVHVPNTQSGTGFSIAKELSVAELTPKLLKLAFDKAPDWASKEDRASVLKWKDFESFQAGNSFNAGYQLIAGPYKQNV